MIIQFKVIYRFNATSIKIPSLFCRNEKANAQIYVELQGAQDMQNNLEKEQS